MSYEPTFPGENVTPQWLFDELNRAAAEMKKASVLAFEVTTMAPVRPQMGMVAVADGRGWNPLGSATASSTGSNAGLYLYIGSTTASAAWRKL